MISIYAFFRGLLDVLFPGRFEPNEKSQVEWQQFKKKYLFLIPGIYSWEDSTINKVSKKSTVIIGGLELLCSVLTFILWFNS